MAKFKIGDTVRARNGRGSFYQIEDIQTRYGKECYLFDNGSVHIAKRARSGWHEVDRAERGYVVVK